jgi:hypothetical protein
MGIEFVDAIKANNSKDLYELNAGDTFRLHKGNTPYMKLGYINGLVQSARNVPHYTNLNNGNMYHGEVSAVIPVKITAKCEDIT